MKKFAIILILVITATALSHAQVGIGTTTPNPSAMLDVTSTTSGLLIPRMSTIQRVAIASPAEGLIVYDIARSEGLAYALLILSSQTLLVLFVGAISVVLLMIRPSNKSQDEQA